MTAVSPRLPLSLAALPRRSDCFLPKASCLGPLSLTKACGKPQSEIMFSLMLSRSNCSAWRGRLVALEAVCSRKEVGPCFGVSLEFPVMCHSPQLVFMSTNSLFLKVLFCNDAVEGGIKEMVLSWSIDQLS